MPPMTDFTTGLAGGGSCEESGKMAMPSYSRIGKFPGLDESTQHVPKSTQSMPSTTPGESETKRISSHETESRHAERFFQGQKRSYQFPLGPSQGCKSQKKRRVFERMDAADEDTHQAQPTLACPFSKLDGNRYFGCLKFELRRVKDIKQHIIRKHLNPEFYCARCWHTFPDRTRRDEHIRMASCEMQPAPLFEGISDEQREQLKRTVNRGTTMVQQWYDVWDILFPGKERPSSIYRGNFMEETLSCIRNRCQNGNLEARLSTLKNRNGEAVDTELVKDVVTVVCDWLDSVIDIKNETNHSVIDNTHAGCESGYLEVDPSSLSDTSSQIGSLSDLDCLHESVNVGCSWPLTDFSPGYGFEPGGLLMPETSYQELLDSWDL